MKTKNMMLLPILLSISLFAIGCGDKIEEKITETVIEKATDSEVDLDMKDGEASFETEGGSLKTGENLDWPKDSMASLPKPDAQIVSIAEMQEEDATAIILVFNDKDGGSDYMKKLSDIGYVQRSITKSEGSVMYMGAKDDNTSVMLSYEPTEGNGSITLSRNDESTKEFFESKMDDVDEEPIEINMEESMDWPKDAMDNIPVIKAQITSVAQDNERVSIGFKGINEKDMTSYTSVALKLYYFIA